MPSVRGQITPRRSLESLYDLPSAGALRVERFRRNPGEGRRVESGALSPEVMLAPSTGVQGPDGILRPAQPSPRKDNNGREQRLRGSRPPPSRERCIVRFAGIDVGSEKHAVAVVDEMSQVMVKPKESREDAVGYEELIAVLGNPAEVLVVMEATGAYGKNLFASLVARGYAVASVNPMRTHRFASVDLQRTKTDAIDALGIARFAAQKRPSATRLPDGTTANLRELVRLRDRLVQDFGDRIRQLYRLVALGFPEFTRHVRSLDSALAITILERAIRRQRRSSGCGRGSSRSSSTMASTLLDWRWRRGSSRPRSRPSGGTMSMRTAFR
jgi:hypothetical protein